MYQRLRLKMPALADVHLELRDLPDGRSEISMVCGEVVLTVQGEAEAMRQTIEATAEQMQLPWYDLR